jgi:hypothetical protein
MSNNGYKYETAGLSAKPVSRPQMSIMSHLSAAQEMNSVGMGGNHSYDSINFAKQL